MSLDPDDIGLDLEAKHPTCAACRKESDGAKPVMVAALGPEGWLCGTHYDAFLRSEEYKAANSLLARFASFVTRLRQTTYRACWREP